MIGRFETPLALLACWLFVGCGEAPAEPDRHAPAGDDPPPGVPVATDPSITGAPGALWSDAAVWGGTLPDENSDVTIEDGSSVTLDVSTCVNSLTIEGELTFADRDLSLCARYIMVHGRFSVGTAVRPHTKQAVITLLGAASDQDVMGMGTKFLGAMGGSIELHGAPAASWTTLSGPVEAGAITIEVLDASGWQPGDAIAVASGSLDPEEAETRTLAAVDGNTLTLDAPLTFARPGALLDVEGRSLDLRAAVARLSRNVVVQGDEASGAEAFGGHLMVMSGGAAYVDGVEFVRMGQFDRLGRYPFHWHLAGDVQGQYLRNSVVHASFQRGVVVHSSQHATVQGNVVLASVGHGYLVETPDTTANVFERNLALGTRVAKHTEPTLVNQHDNEPSGFWLRSARNTLVGNVAAGSAANGFWYDRTEDGPTNFQDNVAYACAGNAHEGVDFVRQSGLQVQNAADVELQFDGFLAYNNETGVWPTNFGLQTYASFVLADNSAQAVRSETTGGGMARFSDTLFVRRTRPEVAGGSAFALQYGGTADLENPTFVGYGEAPLFSTHDVDRAWTGDIRLRHVTLVDTIASSPAVTLPDIGSFEALDDTFLPRGFYIPAAFVELATPDMTLTSIGAPEPVDVFFGPKRNVYAELVTVLAGEDRFADRGSQSTPFNVASVPLRRSDGYEFTGIAYSDTGFASGHSVICNSAFSYQMTTTPPDDLFAVALDLMGGRWQTDEIVQVRVAIPLPSAPAKVMAMGKTGTDERPDFESLTPAPLAAAPNASEFEDAPHGRYYYDEAAQLLHLVISEVYTVVER